LLKHEAGINLIINQIDYNSIPTSIPINSNPNLFLVPNPNEQVSNSFSITIYLVKFSYYLLIFCCIIFFNINTYINIFFYFYNLFKIIVILLNSIIFNYYLLYK